MMRCYLFTCIVVIHISLIDTSTWHCISFFLQINDFIWWTFGKHVDTRKVWISYNIITVLCIRIFWFATVDMWGNSSTSTLLILGKNLPTILSSWQRKHHDYLFYFCKIVPQHNWNKTWNLRISSMSWSSSIDLSREKCNDWLNCIYKLIFKKTVLEQM